MSLVLEQDHVIVHGVSWPAFEHLLADRGERCGVLLAYDCGRVELRMPSQEHEWIKITMTQIVDAMAFARDLRCRSFGSTTFEREDLARGFEPDACFYLTHAAAIRLERPLDLASLNIQRGRDHGLPSYNHVCCDLGLAPANALANISADVVVWARLASAYATVDDVDMWVGDWQSGRHFL